MILTAPHPRETAQFITVAEGWGLIQGTGDCATVKFLTILRIGRRSLAQVSN